MEENKSYENLFKFGIYQGDSTIIERSFSADIFNPVIRYSVDIRSMIPSIIQRIQKTLSRRNVNYKYDVGNGISYDLLKYYKETSEFLRNDGILEYPKVQKQNINGKVIKGIECKFGLYINDNPIVERDFYVDGYNPASRLSVDIYELTSDIVDEIFNSLKNSDVTHMWEDYELINTYGIYIHQIRDLSYGKRKNLLENVNDIEFIRKTKSYYRKQQ